ncbi:Type 1 glutamine amidotransferase-like domain-containing protein [Clostridium estertheticum]|uniref:Type 1 glutamine amidotransferase-like domain-containing protein n=1 Tax=Clostridium estertheticum TaxID=238834 RepID=A0AA47ELG0_9CLOT|nr:Type 1 glutamine amidotransferase-like domain-containing protein [Clostridium estertheticum]MBU3155814.1 Type 1 glutamine amidotransferase-like domain-containing protein [Clostridium estertheticum]MBU3201426.1 Type 1 glutamine amidotransferase-like domain-containing protein [Clostridium estertheticum]WAG62372.1 Type 1 glutamine amidotransferase-like domain-containing protein [Clostridium estertheticum]WAG63520.1 Type 1 glutamine amidotransferase-like domain-containing protein [Clostridium es
MRKIVLYSDQIIKENRKIDYELLRLLNKKNPSIGYIPSCSDLTRKYFNPKVQYYNELGISNIQYFDLDKEYDETKINDIFQSDAIHLSGGNTFYFLYLLKKRNLVKSLQLYVEQGGILIGISAGSIILSKTIDMAQFGDEDIVGIEDRSSLGIVDFQFMPHWSDDESVKYLDLLKDYSKVKKTTIYACNDGDGIVIDGDDIKFIGNVIKI